MPNIQLSFSGIGKLDRADLVRLLGNPLGLHEQVGRVDVENRSQLVAVFLMGYDVAILFT